MTEMAFIFVQPVLALPLSPSSPPPSSRCSPRYRAARTRQRPPDNDTALDHGDSVHTLLPTGIPLEDGIDAVRSCASRRGTKQQQPRKITVHYRQRGEGGKKVAA